MIVIIVNGNSHLRLSDSTQNSFLYSHYSLLEQTTGMSLLLVPLLSTVLKD